jgi:hypothetical protein
MKTLSRLLVFGALCTGLLVTVAAAASKTFTTSGNNPAYAQRLESWTYTTPATTTITTSISITFTSSTLGSAGGSTNIARNGVYVTGCGAGVYSPGTATNSASATAAAGDYTVTHQFGSGGVCTATLVTTLSW